MTTAKKPLRLGMVGGGEGAYIGNIHRIAARLDGAWPLSKRLSRAAMPRISLG